jgi:hypothetical protein
MTVWAMLRSEASQKCSRINGKPIVVCSGGVGPAVAAIQSKYLESPLKIILTLCLGIRM